MDFIFDLLAEFVAGIIESLIHCWMAVMMRFSDKFVNIDERKIKYAVVIECIALMIIFIIGGVMMLETSGESLWGKILFFSSIGVTVLV